MEEFFQILNVDHAPGIFQQLPFPLFQLMDQLRSGFFLFQLSDLFLISCTYIFFCLCKKLGAPEGSGSTDKCSRISGAPPNAAYSDQRYRMESTSVSNSSIRYGLSLSGVNHIQDPAADTVFASALYHGNSFISL